MGSSYRSSLKRGDLESVEKPLREACVLIREALRQMWDCMSMEDQTDNAASDGGFCERMGIALEFIEGELPKIHASDCATNNAPALPVGPCDCGLQAKDTVQR